MCTASLPSKGYVDQHVLTGQVHVVMKKTADVNTCRLPREKRIGKRLSAGYFRLLKAK
jgi:hypothetical protein